MDYASMLTRAAGLIPVVMILVSAIRKMGMEGVWLTRASFVVGAAVGIASEYAVNPQPGVFLWWFGSILYGLLIGACACGAYDLGDRWLGAKPVKVTTVQSGGTVIQMPEQVQKSDIAKVIDDQSGKVYDPATVTIYDLEDRLKNMGKHP